MGARRLFAQMTLATIMTFLSAMYIRRRDGVCLSLFQQDQLCVRIPRVTVRPPPEYKEQQQRKVEM